MISPNPSNKNPSWISVVSHYLKDPLAAGCAVIPVFYGFIKKSALQTERPAKRMRMSQLMIESLKGGPIIAFIVGTQILLQRGVETRLLRHSSEQTNLNFKEMVASSLIVGTISAPLLAWFNGQTMGKTARESLRALSLRQITLITMRETSFVFSLRMSDPVVKGIQNYYGGENRFEDIGSFISGAIGSIVGHPADTWLTRLQNGQSVGGVKTLMKGSLVKAGTVGLFVVLYNRIKRCFDALDVSSRF